MKNHLPKTIEAMQELLIYLNFCHDGSLYKISFLKERSVDRDTGDLIYCVGDPKDAVNCDIHTELILNSYPSAKKDQRVELRFIKTKSFIFFQNQNLDFSDINELNFSKQGDYFKFNFFNSKQKNPFLEIICEEVNCIEY